MKYIFHKVYFNGFRNKHLPYHYYILDNKTEKNKHTNRFYTASSILVTDVGDGLKFNR